MFIELRLTTEGEPKRDYGYLGATNALDMIRPEYRDLEAIIDEVGAAALPSHTKHDYTIDLVPGKEPP
jgi:hypothetical protein